MDLISILLSKVDKNVKLDDKDKIKLSNELNSLQEVTASKCYNAILSYQKDHEAQKHRMGLSSTDIPYYGQEVDQGMKFNINNIPDKLMNCLKIITQTLKTDIVECEDEGLFVLKGVTKDSRGNKAVSNYKFMIRNSTPESKQGIFVESCRTYEGYTYKLSSAQNISFEQLRNNCSRICFWDCHSYDGKGVLYPTFYTTTDEGNHVFGGTLPFCDIFCLLTYLESLKKVKPELRPRNFQKTVELTNKMFTIMFPDEPYPTLRPQKEELDIFGGMYSIGKFRLICDAPKYVEMDNINFVLSVSSKLQL